MNQFLGWLSGIGCSFKIGTATNEKGKSYTAVRIQNNDDEDRFLYWVGNLDEFLMPSEIASFTKRLNIQVPFFAIDPDTGKTSGIH